MYSPDTGKTPAQLALHIKVDDIERSALTILLDAELLRKAVRWGFRRVIRRLGIENVRLKITSNSKSKPFKDLRKTFSGLGIPWEKNAWS